MKASFRSDLRERGLLKFSAKILNKRAATAARGSEQRWLAEIETGRHLGQVLAGVEAQAHASEVAVAVADRSAASGHHLEDLRRLM
jgi:hypothetical protein